MEEGESGQEEETASRYEEELESEIEQSGRGGAEGHTASGSEMVKLSQEEIERITGGREVEDIYPLTPLQEGLLFHSLYSPESRVYLLQLYCTLRGRIDIESFKKAWQQAIDEYAVLRTSFVWEELEKPLQVISCNIKAPLKQHDWRSVPAAEQQPRFEEYLKQDRERGFDVSRPPLMRLTLIRLDEEVYQFIWSSHHILVDGWSMPLLIKKVLLSYEALVKGEKIELEASQPYKNYIKWLRRQDMAKAEAYWRERLKGFTSPVSFGIDRAISSPSKQKESYDEEEILIPDATTASLQSLSKREQITLNTIMQGAWAILLSRYSAEQDVVFGTVVSGRPPGLNGVETIVGLFINTLPVRVKVRQDAEVGEWLREIQREQVELRQYEYSPLVDVQGWSDVPRGQSLFDSILVFQNLPVDATLREWSGSLEISNLHSEDPVHYPLAVVAALRSSLTLKIMYNTDHFSADAVKRMLRRFRVILHTIAMNPTLTPGSLQSALDESDKQYQIVKEKELMSFAHQRLKNKFIRQQVKV
jgi:hypothetical protein